MRDILRLAEQNCQSFKTATLRLNGFFNFQSKLASTDYFTFLSIIFIVYVYVHIMGFATAYLWKSKEDFME